MTRPHAVTDDQLRVADLIRVVVPGFQAWLTVRPAAEWADAPHVLEITLDAARAGDELVALRRRVWAVVAWDGVATPEVCDSGAEPDSVLPAGL